MSAVARSPARPARPRGKRRVAAESTLRVPVPLLAAALRAHSDGVAIAGCTGTSRELRLLFANESLCAIVGRKAASLLGASPAILHADDADLQGVQAWLERVRPGQTLAGEGLLRRGDGATLAASWSFSPLFDRRQRLTHVVATYRDQTDRRRRQDTLVHAQRLDAVGRLAGGVAHDFNNLISVINGYCEMLAARVATNPQAMREVAEIHHAGRKAAALTQQLLAFSRRQPFHARALNLNSLIGENVDILRRLVGEAGQLDFELAADLPNIRTDPAQFQQVLLNLVLNARDALRDRGRIVVSTSCREVGAGYHRRITDLRPGRYVVLTVADNGTGMDAETQGHLFEPFFTTKPEGKGTGLGLALVYGVVQQSGGDIAVRSALLVGSTFEIILPITTEAAVAPAPQVTPLPATRGHETVAVVEEEEIVRKMVAGMLTADGYRVIAVDSIAALAQEPAPPRPTQLLIAAPSAGTTRLARRLLKQNPALCFLCVRSYGESHTPVTWLPPNRQGVVTKPYALSELVRGARKLLDA